MTNRQQIYIRALETLPNLTVHYGHFLQSVVSMRLAKELTDGTAFVDVIKREEKGSDVNIASYMLVDAFRNDCDQLIVITNDSDLAEPIRIINKDLKIAVGVFNPQTNDTVARKYRASGRTGPVPKANPSIELRKAARFVRAITSEGANSHVALSQFSTFITDSDGRQIHKPASWLLAPTQN